MKRLLICFLMLGLLSGIGYSQSSGKDSGLRAPQLEVQPINRDGVCQIGNPGKKYTVLLFWTTWCPHCAVAMQDMNEYFERYNDKVKFCAIAIGEDPRSVKDYISSLNIKFPVVVDERGKIAFLYGVMGVPTIYVIDPQGYVIDYGYSLRRIVWRLVNSLDNGAEDRGEGDGGRGNTG